MRKVLPRDEVRIDVKQIPARLERFNNRGMNNKTIADFHKLTKFLESAAEKQPVAVIKRIYRFVDKLMEDNVYEFSACAKGCAHCCKVPVSVTNFEAAYIEWETRKTQKSPMKIPYGPYEKRVDVDYCPLLDQETATCTAYHARPLNCRSFASMDHWKECEDSGNSHQIHTWQSSEMIKIIRRFLNNITKDGFDDSVPDIRDWF